MISLPHLGEILALLTAFLWGIAVVLFKKSGETVHPVALNLFKTVLGSVLLLATVWVVEGTSAPQIPARDLALLLISGAIGIGIADTLFFKMLNRLGAATTAIVDCLYSPTVILASVIWLGESLSLLQLCGVALIVSAVWEAVRTPLNPPNTASDFGGRPETPPNPPVRPGGNLVGVVWGLLAICCMAISIVIMKPMFDRYSLLWVMETRMLGGVAVLIVLLLFMPGRREILKSLMVKQGRGYLISSSIMGQYLALLLWAAGIKYTQASQAAAINQTSNLFVFVLAGVFLKEKLTRQRIIGIALAVVGVYLVTFG